MRNYLFDRPGSGLCAAPSPKAKKAGKKKKEKKRKRQGNRWGCLVGAVVTAVLILALTVGALFLLPRILWGPPGGGQQGQTGTGSQEDTTPPQSGNRPSDRVPAPSPSEGAAETTITRAPTGDGTTIPISPTGETPLTANEVYEKALPSVVSILAYGENKGASGSGIIMSESGYVITNYHIIRGASEARVYLLSTGEGYDARVVGWAEDLDLAVLKIKAPGLVPAEFAPSRDLVVGDPVYALGNPLGYLYGSLTEGIISATARSITLDGYEMTLMQTSAPLNSGNSGGALLNRYGQVVGITTAKLSTPSSDVVAEGLGLAIPISEVRGCINSIIARGEVVTPRMGIYCYATEVDGVKGILVDSLEEGPAREAGILAGDLIIALNGESVNDVNVMKDTFYDIGVGGEAVFTILRGGEELTISLILSD